MQSNYKRFDEKLGEWIEEYNKESLIGVWAKESNGVCYNDKI